MFLSAFFEGFLGSLFPLLLQVFLILITGQR